MKNINLLNKQALMPFKGDLKRCNIIAVNGNRIRVIMPDKTKKWINTSKEYTIIN